FMPVSSVLHVFQNRDKSHNKEEDIIPSYKDSIEKQKMIYAMRNVLNKPTRNTVVTPGWNLTIQSYNLFARNVDKLDDSTASRYINTFTRLTKFAYESARLKRLLTPYKLVFIREPLLLSHGHVIPTNRSTVSLSALHDASPET